MNNITIYHNPACSMSRNMLEIICNSGNEPTGIIYLETPPSRDELVKFIADKPCLSPVAVWQMLLTRLLEQHYGLTLNDTPFSDETVIKEHIDAGITLANAVNFLVEKYELVRIDRRGFSWQEQTPYLTITDIMRARRDLGLMNRN